MRALPARRIALGACCAALLVGITGPTAMAADAAREHTRAVSSDTLLAQVGNLDAHEHELTPVVDLLKAVLEADGGQLPPDEARRLGEAAKEALADAVAKSQATAARTTVPSAPPAPVTDPLPVETDTDTDTDTEADTEAEAVPAETLPAPQTLPADAEPQLVGDLLGALREAVDSLLDLLLPADEQAAAQAPSASDSLLTHVGNLVDALVGTEPQVSVQPAPATTMSQTQVPLLQGITLPTLASVTSLLLPPS
ncbi:hypothetical protein GCM10010451_06640 [Streptomyces virens]|uniref:Secreted protein n=1 Tax=Streptomyces virens TaxID=285572 RepID=A0ABP6NXM4_9ACTN|nr:MULTISPECIES: hypothetical protein [Streptomyces]MBA8978283.1 hypothetical protein [Streptomyces calvus]MYS28717.1 hypothetical protein [Streptomyces sp. SID7804]